MIRTREGESVENTVIQGAETHRGSTKLIYSRFIMDPISRMGVLLDFLASTSVVAQSQTLNTKKILNKNLYYFHINTLNGNTARWPTLWAFHNRQHKIGINEGITRSCELI